MASDCRCMRMENTRSYHYICTPTYSINTTDTLPSIPMLHVRIEMPMMLCSWLTKAFFFSFFFIRSCTHTCILAHETLVHALKNCTVAFNPIPDLSTVASKLYNQRLPLTNVFLFSFFNGIFIILSMFNAFIYAFHIKKRFWRQMVCACPYFPTRLEAKGCTKFLFPM